MNYSTQQLTEIRKQIMPRYIGQKVKTNYFDEPCEAYLTGITGEFGAEVQIIEDGNVFEHPEYVEYDATLQLIPISSITDEDAIEVAKIIGVPEKHPGTNIVASGRFIMGKGVEFMLNKMANESHRNTDIFHAHQYLQLKGYALPQLVILDGKPVTISVEHQVELGIIELTK